MALCGAKNRQGEPCKKHALIGETRCKLHGGAAAKKNKGNSNARTHGIYSSVYSDEEKEIWDGIELGRIDDELKLCRIRLKRALEAEQKADGELELDARTEEPAVIGGMPIDDEQIVKRSFKRRDYSVLIDRLMVRIESLERTRVELMKAIPPKPDKPEQEAAPEYVLKPDEPTPEKPIL